MQLSFEKQINGEISVRFKSNNSYEEFSYSKMVRKMYDEKTIEEPELIGDFTAKERTSISELMGEFRNAIIESNQADDVQPFEL